MNAQKHWFYHVEIVQTKKSFSTSRKTNVGPSDINIKSVLSSQTMGHAGLETFC